MADRCRSGLRELVESADVLCVQLDYFSRYHGLLGDRFLRHCKPNQVVVSTAHSRLFDEAALAAALRSGRIAAAWLDSVEPGVLDPHRPLAGIETLQVTPRIAATTLESRQRSAWAVARRIDELLDGADLGAGRLQVRRFQARSLISKPIRCRRELGDPALFLSDDLRSARARRSVSLASLAWALAISPSRRSISFARRAISARRSISMCRRERASRRRPRPAHRWVAAAKVASSSKQRHLARGAASACSSGAAARDESASPTA